MRMACRILACVVLFKIVAAVPLKNDGLNNAVTEQTNLRMASPSYIRSIENFNRDQYLEPSIYNVPIPTNLNSNFQNSNQYVLPRETDSYYQQPQPLLTKFQTRFSENPYRNINADSATSPILREVINATRKQNANREAALLQKTDQSLQRWQQLRQGSSTLQSLLSNPNLLRNILSPRPKVKKYTVVYPNGTIGYEDNLDMIASRYPNHLLINAKDVHELSSASREAILPVNEQQDKPKTAFSNTLNEQFNKMDNTLTSAIIEQNSQSKFNKSDSQVLDSPIYTAISDLSNKQTPDYVQPTSVISKSLQTSLPLSDENNRHDDTSSINSSNDTLYPTNTISQNLQITDDAIRNLERKSTNQELHDKNRYTNQTESFDDTKNFNSSVFENLSSSNQTKKAVLSTDIKLEETKNSHSMSEVNDKVGSNEISLEKAEISPLNITSQIKTVTFKDLETSLQNETIRSDTDNLDKNISDAKNETIKDNDSDVNDTDNTATELLININTNSNLNYDVSPPSTVTTDIINETLFNNTFSSTTISDELFELEKNETNNIDTEISGDSFVESYENNETNPDGPWVHEGEIIEDDETDDDDDGTLNKEDGYNKSTTWVKTDKENIANMLFGEGNENTNVYFMFYNPPEVEVEKETKTTIYPNGTIVEEYIETRKDLDGGPTIKTIIIKTYNFGIDSNDDCNCTSNKR